MHTLKKTLRSTARALALGLAAAAVAGCAAIGSSATPEEAVKARATERWNALLKGDMRAAYGYALPSFRAVTSFERYNSQIGGAVRWLNAEVLRVECESAEKCTARIKIEAEPIVSGRTQGRIFPGINETWLLEDGQWWHYQKL